MRDEGNLICSYPPQQKKECWEGLINKSHCPVKGVSLILAPHGKCQRQGLLDNVSLADVQIQLKYCKTQVF